MSLFLKLLIKTTKQQLILPFYHLVNNDVPNYVKHLYKPKTTLQFNNDLDLFLKYYNPISLQDLILINQKKKKIEKPSFHLTFDDGLSNFYDTVAPILLKKGISATIFLNTDFVDNRDLFYRYKASLLIDNYLNTSEKTKEIYVNFIGKENPEVSGEKRKEKREKSEERRTEFVTKYLLEISFKNKDLLDKLATKVNFSFKDFLEKEKPYLTTKQIKELQKQGFAFGAHSCNHPFYTDLTLKEQLKQTNESLTWLQENLVVKYNVFSFPFSDVGVSKAFFNSIDLDLSFGTSGIKKDVITTNLQRLDMEKLDVNLKQTLLKEHLKYMLKVLFSKNKMKRI